MTAPGDSVLIFLLLALFVACCAYAAGRLHQRYQTARDRAEAYRDGYEEATRSVFSLAARMIVPRRSVRASAPVLADVPTVPIVPARRGGTAAEVVPAGGGTAAEEVPAGGAAVEVVPPGGGDVCGLSVASGADVVPARPAGVFVGPAAPGRPLAKPVDAGQGFPVPPPVSPAAVGGGPALGERPPLQRRAAGRRAVPEGPRVDDAKADPPAGKSPGAGEPEAGVLPQALRRPVGHRAADEEAANSAGVSTGRHTVPDELVQAATYHLPPDRIFRAKVREPDGPAGEPTTHRTVPKPRQS
jgi:hypothetical protein